MELNSIQLPECNRQDKENERRENSKDLIRKKNDNEREKTMFFTCFC